MRIEFCLRASFLLSLLLLAGGIATAQTKCDNKCRERYTFNVNIGTSTFCIDYELKDCIRCVGTNDRCTENDSDPGGKCQEDPTTTQRYQFPECYILCSLNGEASAQAVFEPGSGGGYEDVGRGRLRCVP